MAASASSQAKWARDFSPRATRSPSVSSSDSDAGAFGVAGIGGKLPEVGRAGDRLRRLLMRDSDISTVSLVYLARLHEAFGKASERVEVPAGVTSVAALRTWLAERGGVWAAELAPGRA